MGTSALYTWQMETHDVDPKGNTRERPEKLRSWGQLPAGREVLGPRLYLLEGTKVCCFSRDSVQLSPPLIFLLFSR